MAARSPGHFGRIRDGRFTPQGLSGSARGLVVTVTSDTALTVVAAELLMINARGQIQRATNVNVTVDLAAAGLDTGAEASNTWYYIQMFGDGKNVTGRLSASATAPTAPTDYAFNACVGEVRNDGSSNLWRTRQQGTSVRLVPVTNPTVLPVIANGVTGTSSNSSPVLSSASVASFAPPTATAIAIYGCTTWKGGTVSDVYVAPSTGWGGTNRGTRGTAGQGLPFAVLSADANGISEVLLETSSIAIAMSASGGAVLAAGWRTGVINAS